MNYPNLCVVDTNVAKTANLAIEPDSIVQFLCETYIQTKYQEKMDK